MYNFGLRRVRGDNSAPVLFDLSAVPGGINRRVEFEVKFVGLFFVDMDERVALNSSFCGTALLRLAASILDTDVL